MKCLLILSWFLSHGYPNNEAVGITNNLYIESKCNPNANNKFQIGIAQWQGTRKNNLLNFAYQTNRNQNNLYLQLEFLNQEWKKISTTKSHVARNTSHVTSNSSSSYSYLFCQKFEKPKQNCNLRNRITNQIWEK